jgi:hypothetical protein
VASPELVEVARSRISEWPGRVVPQMPSISDLDRLRRAARGAVGVGASPVPADDPDTGVAGQSRRQSVGATVRQQVDRSAADQVDQYRAVVVTAPQPSGNRAS